MEMIKWVTYEPVSLILNGYLRARVPDLVVKTLVHEPKVASPKPAVSNSPSQVGPYVSSSLTDFLPPPLATFLIAWPLEKQNKILVNTWQWSMEPHIFHVPS